MSARRSWIRWGGVGAALCALSLLSCKEAVMEPLTVAAVEVAGGGVNLRLGQTAQLTPTLKSAKGYVLPKVGISWNSSDGARASISPSGQVTAVSRGPVTLTASAGGASGTAAVTVIGVQSIALAPETLSVIVTQTRPMTATTVLDPGVTVTPTWRSLDTTIARVGTDGRVTATSTTGIARIEVTAEDKKDTAVVRVVPVPVVSVVVSPDTATRTVGQTLQLTATPKDSIGGTLTGRVVTWSSSDTARASVSTLGLVTVKAAGTATITATVEGKSGSAGLTLKVPVADVTVAQSSCTGSGSFSGGTGRLYTSETCEYGALVRDAAGNSLTDRTVTWSSSDSTVAKIDGAPFAHPATGLSTVRLLPRKAGTITLTAAVEGKSNGATVTVLIPVASVQISPATTTITVGTTQQLNALPKDSLGGTLLGRSVSWSSSDTAKATVSATGLVTAKMVGTVTITATSEGRAASAIITIGIDIPVSSIDLSPPGTLLFVAESLQLTSIAKDQAGNPVAGKMMTWLSTASTVASVSIEGVVTALSPGITRIIASSNGKADTSVVQVEATTWSLVGHMSNGGGMFDGDCDLSRTCNFGTFVAAPTPGTPDFWRAAPFSESQADILFLSGDRRVWGKADYGQLISAVQARAGTLTPNIVFESGINGVVATTTGNVLSRAGNIEDPWIGLRGSHDTAKADSLMVWGEYNYCEPPGVCNHVDLKNTRGGVNVYLRPRAATDIANNLLAYYPFNGNAQDFSGVGRNGIVSGNVTATADRYGIPGQAMLFRDAGRIDIGPVDLTGAFSLSAWIRPDVRVIGAIVSRFLDGGLQGWEMLYSGDQLQGCIRLHTRGETGSKKAECSLTLETGRWYHVAATYDGTSIGRIYIDGSEVAAQSGLQPDIATSTRALIGRSAWDAQTFVGAIDDVAIWQRTLTASEVSSLYGSTATYRSCKDLLTARPLTVSGLYRIIPDGTTGSQTTAFCDMSTDGGGWTKVLGHNITNNISRSVSTNSITEGLRLASIDSGAVSDVQLSSLKSQIGFTEFRFSCLKPSVGRRIHIKTNNAAVLSFLTRQTNTQPDAVGSFSKLADDNSFIAAQPERWGMVNGQYLVGKWGEGNSLASQRLANHTMFIQSTAHWLIDGGRMECDDFGGQFNGQWSVFVR